MTQPHIGNITGRTWCRLKFESKRLTMLERDFKKNVTLRHKMAIVIVTDIHPTVIRGIVHLALQR